MFTDNYKKYRKSIAGLNTLATKYKTTPAVIGETVINEKLPSIAQYIKANGMAPAKNPQALSVQFTLLHQQKIADKMKKTPGLSYVSAEKQVFADEERAEYYGGEYESFAPAIIGALLSVGAKGIGAINEKRQATGKKPILSGKFWSFLSKNVSADTSGNDLSLLIKDQNKPMKDTELNAGLQAMNDELIAQGKKSWIQKNKVVLIVIGVLAIAGLYWFVIRKK